MTQPAPGPYQPAPQVQYHVEQPGSKPWVERRYGRVTDLSDRIVPGLIDIAIPLVLVVAFVALGGVLLVMGLPETYSCGPYGMDSCDVPGTGNGLLIGTAIVMFVLSFFAPFAFICWNRIWRVHRTGQSLGRKVAHLRVIDAVSGTHPQIGPMILREVVRQIAGFLSWIWILLDTDDRSLADIVGSTHVIHDPGQPKS